MDNLVSIIIEKLITLLKGDKFIENITLVAILGSLVKFIKWLIERRDLKSKADLDIFEKIIEKKVFSNDNSLLVKKIYSDKVSYLRNLKKISDRKFILKTTNSKHIENLYEISVLSNNGLITLNTYKNSFIRTDKAKKFWYQKKFRYMLFFSSILGVMFLAYFLESNFSNLSKPIKLAITFIVVIITEIFVINHLDKIKYLRNFEKLPTYENT